MPLQTFFVSATFSFVCTAITKKNSLEFQHIFSRKFNVPSFGFIFYAKINQKFALRKQNFITSSNAIENTLQFFL